MGESPLNNHRPSTIDHRPEGALTTVERLDALPGMEGAKRLVRRLATGQSGVHAVLLYGAPGGGTPALADVLAQAWLCTNPGPEGACGTCQSCGAFGRGKNADLLRLGPTGNSRIFKLGAIIPMSPPDEDNPSPLKPFFRTMPLYARHKVAILSDAERMNGSAANALLKTLEEPHPHAKLILTTTSVGALLPTIRSRCLAVAVALPHGSEIRTTYPEATADDLILAEGAPGRLAEILADPGPYRDLAELARSLPRRRRAEALVLTERVRAIAERLEKSRGLNARAANAEALATLAGWTARDPDADPRWTGILAEAHRRVLGNGNAGIVMDAAFAKMLG